MCSLFWLLCIKITDKVITKYDIHQFLNEKNVFLSRERVKETVVNL